MQNKVGMRQDHRYKLEAVAKQILKKPLQQCYPNLVTTDIGAAIPVSAMARKGEVWIFFFVFLNKANSFLTLLLMCPTQF